MWIESVVVTVDALEQKEERVSVADRFWYALL
jgi:hypothetical protein